jgi:dTDP-4-amino-4,6-dideoxygalactose transaminase
MLNLKVAPWPSFSHEEAELVAATLRSGRVNYWTGEEGRHFEREFAAWCASNHAIALANGTLALDLALQALGIGQGDEVIVTPRTFIASVSSVVNAGAKPVFADVCRESGNICADTIAPMISPRTKAIIPVHLAGWPCDMTAIMKLADAHNLAVIEDCAQAHGARHGNRSVGTFGHVGAWSFCQDKIMTTGGEGGMVTTNDESLWSHMWSFKDHGKSWDAVYNREHAPGFRWLHESFGTNWRMLEMQSVIGRYQLSRMEEWQAQRTLNAMAMVKAVSHFASVRVPLPPVDDVHAFYRLYIYVEDQALKVGWNRDRIVAELTARGTPAFQGTCSEVYLERAFKNTDFRPKERLPVARLLGETSIMLLTHPTLTKNDLDKICDALTSVFSDATRS